MKSAPSLNSRQQEAVSHAAKELLIVAGAGTGKTTVITEKVVHAIEEGATASSVLALTFTEKAAQEMEERIEARLEPGFRELQVSTFHAFCQGLLQDYGLDIGISPQFRLLTQIDAWQLMREHLDTFTLEYYKPLGNPSRHIHALIDHFSRCKDQLISPEAYQAYADSLGDDVEESERQRINEVAVAYAHYQKLLHDSATLDFADVMYYCVELLNERPAIRAVLQEQYKLIVIDEFQDVNHAQYELIHLLHGENQLVVVGDDDQSIYAFRGASVRNIMRFTDDYKDAAQVVLNTNYRSGQNILDTAYKSISFNNPNRLEHKLGIDKSLTAHSDRTGEVQHLHGASIHDEVALVIEEIKKLSETNKDFVLDDVAILVRANAHAEPFLTAFARAGIPYECLSASGLYRQDVVLDVLAFIRAITDIYAAAPVYRLMRLEAYALTENDMQKLLLAAKRKTLTYYQALKTAAHLGVSADGVTKAESLIALIHDGLAEARKKKPTAVVYAFLESSGYFSSLAKQELAGERQAIRDIAHVKQLFELIEQFELLHPGTHIQEFLAYYESLIEAGDQGSMYQPADTPDSVNIITMHGSKGLEYPYVFMVNMVDDRVPSRNRKAPIELPPELLGHEVHADAHIEEERRLFYVGCTRAKKRLYFVSSSDYGGKRKKKLSRFLSEIGFTDEEAVSVKNFTENQESSFTQPAQEVLYQLPKKFSFSQVRSYQSCPYQYKLGSILKIPTRGNARFSYGQSMHLTLQKFYEHMLEANSAAQGSLFEAPVKKETDGLIVMSLDKLLELYKRCFIHDWYESAANKKEYYALGLASIKAFYESHKDDWQVPLAIEAWFSVDVQGNTMHGRIDRIDQLPDGSLEIIDYKTGTPKEKLSADDKLQLLLYQHAAQSLPEFRHVGPVSKLTFYYLNDNTKVSFLGKDTELEKMRDNIGEVLGGIQGREFSATPSQRNCGFCDFRDICSFRAA
ncbi:MAG: ATP-dependent helicase [Candidatus Magasanikbacteria bacterium]|jgi:DNA helicase II / ATP-dependent DNA helicase PcrA|nr:ATP-dependent helicase [Candidatus Magasanikbacteria bacterium]